MGLDSVELVITVEEAFGFSIPDQDAASLDTVGKLYEYILAHRYHGKQESCLSSVAFYRVRRALISVLSIARGNLRPSVNLSSVIPRRRRRVWHGLKNAIGLCMPELVRPKWVVRLGSATAIGGLTLALLVLVPRLGIGHGAFWAVVAALGIGCVVYWLTVPLATEFRPEFSTVGGLTKAILARNYGAISDECGKASAREVWESLRAIIVEQMGVRPEAVTKEASFVKDLGVT